MKTNNKLLTGTLTFKGVRFIFVLEGTKLTLIPKRKKSIDKFLYKKIGKGAYTFREPIKLNEKYLIGQCDENLKIVYFISDPYLYSDNNVLIIYVNSYIEIKGLVKEFNGMTFSGSELEYFYQNRKIRKGDLKREKINLEVSQNHSKSELFYLNKRKVSVSFGNSETIFYGLSNYPLESYSIMCLKFDDTSNYNFIYKLYFVVRNFMSLMCYRNDISFNKIELSARYDENNDYNVAEFIMVDDSGNKQLDKKLNRCIKYNIVQGHIGEMLQDISDNKIYWNHIPDSLEASKTVTAGTFVITTACFEWLFRQLYPNGIVKSDKTLVAENEVISQIDEILKHKECKGKTREIYKRLKNSVSFDSLGSEIRQVFNDYKNIINPFSSQLETLNKGYDSKNIGDRLAKQRNNFAHGNIDKDFDFLALIDLILIKRVVYIMQLKIYNIDDFLIKQAINEVFACYISDYELNKETDV